MVPDKLAWTNRFGQDDVVCHKQSIERPHDGFMVHGPVDYDKVQFVDRCHYFVRVGMG